MFYSYANSALRGPRNVAVSARFLKSPGRLAAAEQEWGYITIVSDNTGAMWRYSATFQFHISPSAWTTQEYIYCVRYFPGEQLSPTPHHFTLFPPRQNRGPNADKRQLLYSTVTVTNIHPHTVPTA